MSSDCRSTQNIQLANWENLNSLWFLLQDLSSGITDEVCEKSQEQSDTRVASS